MIKEEGVREVNAVDAIELVNANHGVNAGELSDTVNAGDTIELNEIVNAGDANVNENVIAEETNRVNAGEANVNVNVIAEETNRVNAGDANVNVNVIAEETNRVNAGDANVNVNVIAEETNRVNAGDANVNVNVIAEETNRVNAGDANVNVNVIAEETNRVNVGEANVENIIKNILLVSLVTTVIIVTLGIITQAQYGGGLCLTLLQIVLICIAGVFFLLQLIFDLCLQLYHNRFECCTKKCLIQGGSTCFLYSLLHFILYLLLVLVLNFFVNPVGYLPVLLYLILSVAGLWIGNTISFAYAYRCKCKHVFFAMLIIFMVNTAYFVLWNFFVGYYYDERPQISSIMSLIPGLAVIGGALKWYRKLFTLFRNILNEESIRYGYERI